MMSLCSCSLSVGQFALYNIPRLGVSVSWSFFRQPYTMQDLPQYNSIQFYVILNPCFYKTV